LVRSNFWFRVARQRKAILVKSTRYQLTEGCRGTFTLEKRTLSAGGLVCDTSIEPHRHLRASRIQSLIRDRDRAITEVEKSPLK
jgi:hypothetical protein